jgi:flavin-dependent dehydrogenase
LDVPWRILRAAAQSSLGVHERVAMGGFTQTVAARVRWHFGDEERMRGLTVDRGAFVAILLERAREAGAEVFAPATVRGPARCGESWEVALDGRVLHASFLAEATGRRHLLGGRRAPTSPRTLALHAIWRRESPSGCTGAVYLLEIVRSAKVE